MSTVLAKAEVKIGADTSQLSAAMARAETTMRNAGQRMSQVGRSLSFALTAPLALISGVAVKVAVSFDASMRKIGALVGINEQQLQTWRDEISKLGPEFGVSAGEAADAMFYITSAGLRGSQAMEALQASLKGAAIGLGDTKTVADAATSAMNAYAKEGLTATRATEILAAGVREGKLEASSLAPVLGQITGLGASLGVSFEALVGTLAALSKTGTDAAAGATEVQQIMSSLIGKSPQAVKALGSVGLTFDQLRKVAGSGPRGLVNVMRLLETRFKGNIEGLNQVIPNIRAFRGVMNLLAQDTDSVNKVLDNTANSQGFLAEALRRTEGPAFDMRKTWAELQKAALDLGNVLIPVVVPALKAIADKIKEVSENFKKASPFVKGVTLAIAGMTAAIGPALIALGGLARALSALGVSSLVKSFTGLRALFAGGLVTLIVGGLAAIAGAWVDMKITVAKTAADTKLATESMLESLRSLSPASAAKVLAKSQADEQTHLNNIIALQVQKVAALRNVEQQRRRGTIGDLARAQAHADAIADEIKQQQAYLEKDRQIIQATQSVVDIGKALAGSTDTNIKKTGVATDAAAKRAEILADLGKALAAEHVSEQLLGADFDGAKAKAQLLGQAITDLIAHGADENTVIDKTGHKLPYLIEEWQRLNGQVADATRLHQLITSSMQNLQNPISEYEANLAFLREQVIAGNVSNEEYVATLQGMRAGLSEGQRVAVDLASALGGSAGNFAQIGEDFEHATDAIKKMQGELENTSKKSDQLKQALLDTAGRAVDAFVDFAFSGKASFGDFVRSALADIAKLILKLELLQLIASAFPGLKIPGFQHGGFLRPGELGIVGEAGPELVSGGRNGVSVRPVTPTSVPAGGGTAGDTVHMTFQIQANDAQGVKDFIENSQALITNAVLRSFQRSRILRDRMGG